MPNALRKVLDIFLAFKLPGSEGLSNKVDNITNGGYGLDAARICALDRLVQLESHADNLDDVVNSLSCENGPKSRSADIIERDVIRRPVVEFRRARAFMGRNSLRAF
jgi:hypothetical protein